MTDGMVLKVDAFDHRDRLGATSKAPRWVIAYKYETEQQPTVLNDVRWQVGKGGSLTPVGDVEPVFISGVTVTHVTLHNIDQIASSTCTSATPSSSSGRRGDPAGR
jgi:DNA ligase (NAD+)